MNSNSEPAPRFGVIILAASRGAKTIAEFGTAHKCTLTIAGKPMLMRVLEALAACPLISEMVISIDAPDVLHTITGYDELAAKHGITVRKSQPSAPESAADAIAAIGQGYPILVTTGDNVLLTPEAVSAFCTGAAASDTDLAFGLLTEQSVSARFPNSVRTFWRFRDGGYKACNLYGLLTPQAEALVRLWRKAEKNRKKPWKVAAMMGPSLLLSFLLKRDTLAELLERVASRLKVRAAPVILPFPEIAIDVDRTADIAEAEKVLAQRRADSR